MASVFSLRQTIFRSEHPDAQVVIVHLNDLTEEHLLVPLTLAKQDGGVVGLAPSFGSNEMLSTLAVATMSLVLIIKFSDSPNGGKKKKKNKATKTTGVSLLEQMILCSPGIIKVAFQMDVVATALYQDRRLHIVNAVDILSLPVTSSARHSLAKLMQALGAEGLLIKTNAQKMLQTIAGAGEFSSEDIAHQAWVARHAMKLECNSNLFEKAPRINTAEINKEKLKAIAKAVRDACRLDSLKPTRVQNEITSEASINAGQLNVQSTRFRTRVTKLSSNQRVEISDASGKVLTTSKTVRVDGKQAQISINKLAAQLSEVKISTVGKEALTSAESQRESILLQALQGQNTIFDSSFVRAVWFPSSKKQEYKPVEHPIPLAWPGRKLNPSQEDAVKAILSSDEEVTLIQGPPGTGKTTVIAAAVWSLITSSVASKRTVWLVAQSNIAVKNIAEKLASIDFFDFKVLVSKDFHFDWHEHLYEKIDENLIRSEQFPRNPIEAERMLLGSRVVLCTLSMLSNSRISSLAIVAPVETVIVDEASQIEVGDYLPMFSLYNSTLKKAVFIGDQMQLAPYGQDDIGDLESVFEKPHLVKRARFLDTQYRMPHAVGKFISRIVYSSRLQTVHDITSMRACRFIDVANSQEQNMGHSWVNQAEIAAITLAAKKLTSMRKKFKIITPYDAQRSELEKRLKAEKLPWEDKCFNVDSFQGNEEDYILISVVRSFKIGFLSNQRRTNVMLTRCKRGMFIFSSRSFILQKARKTLMNSLAVSLGESTWVNSSSLAQYSFE